MMERPFFSIAKRKRLRSIEYENDDGSVCVKVSGHNEQGMATTWDADILIYCISRVMAARDRGDKDFSPSWAGLEQPAGRFHGADREGAGR